MKSKSGIFSFQSLKSIDITSCVFNNGAHFSLNYAYTPHFISNCGINNIFSVVLKSIWVVIDFIFHELVVSYKRSGGVIWHLIMFTIILENT